MKTRTIYVVFAAIMMVALGVGAAFAERPCFSVLENLSGLNLTTDQKTKLEEKQMPHCKKMIRLRVDLFIEKLEKNKMVRDRNFNREAVQKQIEKIMDMTRNMQMAKLDALADVRDVLTDEQWAEYSDRVTRKCDRPCFDEWDGDRRQRKTFHHSFWHRGRNVDCGMPCRRTKADCPTSGGRMKQESQ